MPRKVHWLLLMLVAPSSAACSSCDRPEPPPAREVDDPAAAASRLLERAELIAASADRGDAASSTCARAWSELAAMARADGGLPDSFPTREAFESRCARLPLEVQRCLRVSVSLRDPEGCRQANQALSEADRIHLEGLMDGEVPPLPGASVTR